MKKTNKVKRVKAWAVVNKLDGLPFTAYFDWSKKGMQACWNKKEFKIIPCTITYTLPSKKI